MTAHETIRQALRNNYVMHERTAIGSATSGFMPKETVKYHRVEAERNRQALSLLDSHAVVPREPAQYNET